VEEDKEGEEDEDEEDDEVEDEDAEGEEQGERDTDEPVMGQEDEDGAIEPDRATPSSLDAGVRIAEKVATEGPGAEVLANRARVLFAGVHVEVSEEVGEGEGANERRVTADALAGVGTVEAEDEEGDAEDENR
jgi:hypothetical protein